MQKGIQTHEIISLNQNHKIKVLNVFLELTANISYIYIYIYIYIYNISSRICVCYYHRYGMVDHHYDNYDIDGLQFWSISKLY